MDNHTYSHNKAVVNRMSELIDSMESIKRMTEEGQDCSEILIQISDARFALNNVGKIILEDHVNHCIAEAVEKNNTNTLKSLSETIDKFIGINSQSLNGIH